MEDSSRIQTLPQEFLSRMEQMLGDEYEAFINSYHSPRSYGLRVNTSKISCEEFEQIVPFKIERIPWTQQRIFLSRRSPSLPVSFLPGRTLLSPGAKRHDPGCLSSHRTGRSCTGSLRSAGRQSHCPWRRPKRPGASYCQ